MTSDEFRRALQALGLSQAQFARLTRSHPVSVSRWATGDRAVPQPIAAVAKLDRKTLERIFAD